MGGGGTLLKGPGENTGDSHKNYGVLVLSLDNVSCESQVKKSELKETWESSPDRYLLELGGIKTKRPTEQQQQ